MRLQRGCSPGECAHHAEARNKRYASLQDQFGTGEEMLRATRARWRFRAAGIPRQKKPLRAAVPRDQRAGKAIEKRKERTRKILPAMLPAPDRCSFPLFQ